MLSSDPTEQTNALLAMRQILESTSRFVGADFCSKLVEAISSTLGFRYAFIAMPQGDQTDRMKTVAFWSGETLIENFVYELSNSPCQKVMDRSVCFYADHVQEQFPKDRSLQRLGVRSYLGVPLIGRGGNVIAMMAMCDVRPMEDRPELRDLIALLADRAAVELDRWQESEARRESETQVRLLTDRSPVALWTTDSDLLFTRMCGGALRPIGLDREDLIGTSLYELLETTEESSRTIQAHLAAVAGEKRAYEMTFRNRVFQACVEPLRDHSGDITGVIGVAFDVTALKQTQQSLVASELRFRRLVEYAPEAVTLFDLEKQRFVMANAAAVKLFGYTKEEFLELTPVDLSPPKQLDGRPSAEKAMELLELARRGSVAAFDWVHCDRYGRPIQCEVHLLPLEDQGRMMIRGSAVDVSAKRKAEEELRSREDELAHVARISIMGEMAGGVAHELNQPLYAIQNFAKACESLVGNQPEFDRDQLCEWMERISSTAQYAGQVIARLRDFVKQSPLNRRSTDLREIVETAFMLTHFEARRRRVQIEIDLPDSLAPVHADAVQIQQVLVNLIRNGFEAVGELSDRRARIEIAARRLDRVVEVEVRDNGRGLPGDDVSIFDAFTSTKPGGLGLGLAIAKTITEAHGGTLLAKQREGPGAAFRFTLEIADPSSREQP